MATGSQNAPVRIEWTKTRPFSVLHHIVTITQFFSRIPALFFLQYIGMQRSDAGKLKPYQFEPKRDACASDQVGADENSSSEVELWDGQDV